MLNNKGFSIGRVLLTVVAIIFIFGFIASNYGGDIGKQIIDDDEKFTLTDDHGYSDEYGFSYYIEGTVKNNTSYSYSYVQVQFNVYDESGNLIGSCLDNINNLEENGTWKIKALCSGEAKDVKSYKLTGFTSW